MKKIITLTAVAGITIGSLAFYVIRGRCAQGNTPEQLAAFAQLSASAKVTIWTNHLDAYVTNHPNLTEAQADVIQMGRDLLTSQNFYANTASENYASSQLATQMSVLKTAALAVFSHSEVFEIFDHLPEYTDEAEPLVSACSCSTWWGCAANGWSEECATGCLGCSCSQVINCGPFYALRCNGRCVYLITRSFRMSARPNTEIVAIRSKNLPPSPVISGRANVKRRTVEPIHIAATTYARTLNIVMGEVYTDGQV